MTRLEVASAVVVRAGRVLLTQRHPTRSDLGLMWECPGGKLLGGGETHEGAVLRELEEECGLRGRVVERLARVELDPPATRHPCAVSFYLVEVGDQVPRAAEVGTGIGWHDASVLPHLPSTPGNAAVLSLLQALAVTSAAGAR